MEAFFVLLPPPLGTWVRDVWPQVPDIFQLDVMDVLRDGTLSEDQKRNFVMYAIDKARTQEELNGVNPLLQRDLATVEAIKRSIVFKPVEKITGSSITCNNCKQAGVKLYPMQLRSADEPPDIMVECPYCGAKYKLK
jgi:DNA-directed RNA polymerase subunit M/transcription elongation factor TFIIS